jgi:hypothetical protein
LPMAIAMAERAPQSASCLLALSTAFAAVA